MDGGLTFHSLCPEHAHVVVLCKFGARGAESDHKKLVELFVEGTNLANTNYQSNMSRLKYFDNPVVPAGVRPGIFNMGRNVSFKLVVPFDLSPKTKSLGS